MPKKRIQEKPSYLYIFPIAFVIAVVPLIVFMKVGTINDAMVKNLYADDTYTDFFNFYKSQWLLIGTVLSLIFFFAHKLTKRLETKRSFIYIPTFIYAGFIVLSSLLSKNTDVAINGYFNRSEGMISLLCYLVLFLVTFNAIGDESQFRFLAGCLLLSATIIGLIGIFQLFGFDFFRSELGRRLILPEAFHKIAHELVFRFDEKFVNTTFSNSNYVGSYTVLLIPIALASIVGFKNIYLKFGSVGLSLLLIVVLFGSRSRAGQVALGVAMVLAIILFRKILFKRRIIAILSVACIILAFVGVNYVLGGKLVSRILAEFTEKTEFYDLRDITLDGESVYIRGASETLQIKEMDSRLYFYDTEGKKLSSTFEQTGEKTLIRFSDEAYKDFSLELQMDVLSVYQKEMKFQLRIKEDGIKFIGLNGQEIDRLEQPEAWGFAGNERFGSARGYIWSRTLPLLRSKLLIGSGPDTFAIEFPQDDYIGKIRAYGVPQMLVDKPHNLYLQIAVNTGVVSLIAFLVLIGYYLVQSLKLYLKNTPTSFTSLSGACILLSITGYLVAGLFNDSVVGIAPIFWVLLGLGFACNWAYDTEQRKAVTTR